MKIQKADVVFAAGAVLVVVFVALLPSPRDRNPPVPDTPAHRALTSERACTRCHAPDARAPLSSRHPPRKDCLKCHRADFDE